MLLQVRLMSKARHLKPSPYVTLNKNIYKPGTTYAEFLDRFLWKGKLQYRKWRKANGFPENTTSFGPLTNLQDFTYLDGRPTPIGMNLKKRMMKQREYAETIVQLTKEIDFAVDRHKRLTEEAEQQRIKTLNEKLKPKGDRLLRPNC